MTADWPDDNPSAHRAAAIYTQRVPIARNATSLGGQTSQTLLPSTGNTLFSASVLDQPSFEFILATNDTFGLATAPWCEAQFSWLDTVTGNTKAIRTYVNASGNATKNVLRVQGPCRGDKLTLQLSNDDTVDSVAFDWSLSTISHVILEDNAANDALVAVHGFSSPGGSPAKGVVASSTPTIAISGTQSRLLPVRSGRVRIVIDNGASTGAVQVTVTDPDSVLHLYGNSGGTEFYNSGPIAAGGVTADNFNMPLGPTLLVMTNLSNTVQAHPAVSIMQFGGD